MRPFTIFLLIATLVALPGCASKYGEQQTQVNYYPACYRPIQDLRNNEGNVNKNTGAGALVGAFTGAIVGLIATGKWQGALMGGAVGGAGGAMVGNMYGRKQQERDDNIRLASYMQELDGDISNLDVTSAAARTSIQCYDQQFKVLLSEMRARQISRQAAAARFAEIQSGREEAIAILGNAADYGRNLNVEYENALASEEQRLQSSPAASTNVSYAQSAKKIQAVRQRKQTLTQKTAAIHQQKEAAQANTSRQTNEINEAYAALSDIRS